MIKYDYIIAGGGLAGLSLAFYLAESNTLNPGKVLIIDHKSKNVNDRTWSFWEKEKGIFESIVFKKWNKVHTKYHEFERTELISPYQYKTIRGIDFYNFVKNKLSPLPNFKFINERILHIDTDSKIVITEEGRHHGNFIFDSYFNIEDLGVPPAYHDLKQHFLGFVIQTEMAHFDTDCVTYMDMSIPQKEGLRFMYLLPFDSDTALVEFTVFSEQLLSKEEYEHELKGYLYAHFGSKYKILETEEGIIPMTDYPFPQQKIEGYLKIGSKAGFAKPSTGYAFQRTQRYCQQIVADLENGKAPGIQFNKYFLFMDSVLLNVLSLTKVKSAVIFKYLFQRNPMQRLLTFLDEQTSLIETLKIMNTVPIWLFLRVSVKEFFKKR
jgi:lycopene beta-cyclase